MLKNTQLQQQKCRKCVYRYETNAGFLSCLFQFLVFVRIHGGLRLAGLHFF